MIINGGMSYLVPDLLSQFKRLGIDETRITKLLLLHSHFDHVGTVPFFKRCYPLVELYASARSWEILQAPKAIDTINAFSHSVAKRTGRDGVYAEYDLEWRDEIMAKILSDGDCIDVSGLLVQIITTPGHSSCSLSAYVPKLKALFASDAGGIPYKGMIFALGNSNFTRFQQQPRKTQGSRC
jgi:glyoxylase-like metal-dependent hydrolase (beta-lactamase superfamily II)